MKGTPKLSFRYVLKAIGGLVAVLTAMVTSPTGTSNHSATRQSNIQPPAALFWEMTIEISFILAYMTGFN